jgi:hypothetical protein
VKRGIGYTLLFVWVSLAGAAQAFALGLAPRVGEGFGALARALVPDLMTLVLVAAVGRLARRDVVRLALVAAAARAGWTAAPPYAVVAGTLAVALVADSVRRIAELDRPSLRFCAAGAGSLLLGLWLLFVDLVRADAARVSGAMGFGAVGPGDAALPFLTALVTALAGLVLWPLLVRLPGLGRLERRAF